MLTEDEIRRFIDDDASSERKRNARVGQRYYEGDHDIKRYRMFYYDADGVLTEDKYRSNIKISHPFFTELVDQLAAYMLSFEDSPIKARDADADLQGRLDEYFDDGFWSEVHDLVTGANAKGFEYIYAYKSKEDRLAFECADSMGVVEVRAKDTDDGCEYVIYWYVDRIDKGRKKIKRIQVHSKDEIWYYVQVGKGKIERDGEELTNPKPNVVWTDPMDGKRYGEGLGFIPFWRLDNCKKQFSGLKPIKDLIDDYDLMECGLSNNLQDFDTPIHVVKGFNGSNLDELQHNLKTKKLVGVGDNGDLDIRTVDVPYQARKVKADEDEKNIYRFGMGFNSSQVGDGNVTNVVIRSRYTLLDLKAKKMEKRLKKLLRGIIEVVLDEINAADGTGYRPSDVKVEFKHVIPTNEAEDVQNELVRAQTQQARISSVLSAAATIGDEEALKAICDILEIDYEEARHALDDKREVQGLLAAQATLEGVSAGEFAAEDGAAVVS